MTRLRPCLAAAAALVALATAWCGGAAAEAGPVCADQGEASWYGPGFEGRPTASGEPFDPGEMTAAHQTLPLGAEVEVTHQETGESVRVVVNDRGPYVDGRVIDLSEAAAEELDIKEEGVAPVTVEADPASQDDPEVRRELTEQAEASASPSAGPPTC
jgi:rare lipoprotein A